MKYLKAPPYTADPTWRYAGMYDGRVGVGPKGWGSPGQIPPPGGFGIVKGAPTHVKLERFGLSLDSLGVWATPHRYLLEVPRYCDYKGNRR